jgi:hypothetical protein
MLVDVTFNDGSPAIRLVLPGSTLAYGRTGTMDKGAALLWSIWLIAGPSLDALEWFCDNVRSLTTDFGVEMHLLELPDIKEALLAWAAGCPLPRVRMLVKPDQRLFRKALRIAGWSHTMGNIMKDTAEQFPQWPSFLGMMRSMVKFYKNTSYREHIRRRLVWTAEEDKTLKHFTASFAKWRYETVFEVLRQLLDYRQYPHSCHGSCSLAHRTKRKLALFFARARTYRSGGGPPSHFARSFLRWSILDGGAWCASARPTKNSERGRRPSSSSA